MGPSPDMAGISQVKWYSKELISGYIVSRRGEGGLHRIRANSGSA